MDGTIKERRRRWRDVALDILHKCSGCRGMDKGNLIKKCNAELQLENENVPTYFKVKSVRELFLIFENDFLVHNSMIKIKPKPLVSLDTRSAPVTGHTPSGSRSTSESSSASSSQKADNTPHQNTKKAKAHTPSGSRSTSESSSASSSQKADNTSHQNTKKAKIKSLEKQLVVLVKAHNGIIRLKNLWMLYGKKYHTSPQTRDFSVLNLNDVLHGMDSISIYTAGDGEKCIKIAEKPTASYKSLCSDSGNSKREESSYESMRRDSGNSKPNLAWGGGAFSTPSTSSSSSLPTFLDNRGPLVYENSRNSYQTPPNLVFQRQTNSGNKTPLAFGVGLLPVPQSLMPVPLMSSPIVIDSSPEVNRNSNVPNRNPNNLPAPQAIVLSSDDDEEESATAVKTPKTLEKKEIQVERINFRGQLSKAQIEVIVQDCIEVIADANEYVSCERIEDLLLRRLGIQNIFQLGQNIRRIEHLNPVFQHIRLLAKVNAYIQAFVRTRSMYSLYELKLSLIEFVDPEKKSFDNLHLGPLQRLPVVYECFKFPPDAAEIPEITSIHILEYLVEYLSKNNKWTEKLEMNEFMMFLVDKRQVISAYYLGIAIKSLPLAVQVIKKAQRDASNSKRSIYDHHEQKLKSDVQEAFRKFQVVMLAPSKSGENEIRTQYLKSPPERVIQQIFQKYKILMNVNQPNGAKEVKRHRKINDGITNFLTVLNDDEIARLLFYIAVCCSDTLLQESAMEMLNPDSPNGSTDHQQNDKENMDAVEKIVDRPSRSKIIHHLKEYIDRCLGAAHGSLNLAHLSRIEEKLVSDFSAAEFSDLGIGRFLHFLTTDDDAKTLLSECCGSILGSSSTSSDTEGIYKPTHLDILMFIKQCSNSGISQNEILEDIICTQFGIKNIKQLGYGSISTLISSASKTGRHQATDYNVIFEGCLSNNNSSPQATSNKKMGSLGQQTRDTALAILHNCPLLTDLQQWSHWPLVFEPELGPLKDFIQKFGGQHLVKIDESKILTTDVLALETKPGVLLKLSSQSTTEKFYKSLEQVKPVLTTGHLLSLIVLNKGVDNTPIALLANHIKTTLLKLHSEALDSLDSGICVDPAAAFVLECLCLLPRQICLTIANQMFFVPLSEVVGSTKSKTLLLQACQTSAQRNHLEELGCLFGIGEWTENFLKKAKPSKSDIQMIGSDLAEELDDFTENEVIISDNESVTSFLTVEDDDDNDEDEDVTVLSQEEQTETKQVKSEDVIVIDDIVDVSPDEKQDDEDAIDQENKNANACEVETGDEVIKTAETVEILDDSIIEDMDSHKQLIENIRKEVFGVGILLNEDGQKLVKILQERQGRSLDRLSKDLYSKDTHFVLELIQNADDNTYSDEVVDSVAGPSVTFVVDKGGISLLNNEIGFKEIEIGALCDVGKSTKGKHKYGYIGQKGIGFKSVFRVTDRPEIHSNGYHFCFDVHSGPMGYIMPHWIEDLDNVNNDDSESDWTTKIVLPLKQEMTSQTRSLAARFNDIHPSLLLFLHRLKEITIDNKIEDSVLKIQRQDKDNNIIEIKHGNKTDRWLVVKKTLDSSNISLQVKSGVEVESTEIALAFPIASNKHRKQFQVLPDKQLVFAYLPLRNYGFRFIIQGDFDVPSSRECVDRDSAWNQWLRNEIHTLFIHSLDVFKDHPDFNENEALLTFLQFVPMEDEILDFFKPVATQILAKLKAKECMPVSTSDSGTYQWKMPSQTVIVQDPLILDVISPDILLTQLNLYYLSSQVAAVLNPSLARSLGVEVITTEHLLHIGRSFPQMFSSRDIDWIEKVTTISKWMACVYRSLDELNPDENIYRELKTMKIIPLSTGQLTSLSDTTVFIVTPTDKTVSRKSKEDPLYHIERDLQTIDSRLVSTADNEVNSQVQKLLLHVDIKHLSPHDLIHHHILPVLQSDTWKDKSRELLMSYLIYIKNQYDKQPSIIELEKLKSIVQIKTNHGFKSPVSTAIHFTPLYGNTIDLQRELSGYDWVLVDGEYLTLAAGSIGVQQWHHFFSKLGLTNFLSVRTEEVPVTMETMNKSPWAAHCDLLPTSENGYVVSDNVCEEFQALVARNKSPEKYIQQMKVLFQCLEQDWDKNYSRFTSASIKKSDGQNLRNVESSFGVYLKSLKWVPAVEFSTVANKDVFNVVEKKTNLKASDLYIRDHKIENILAHTVNYLDSENINQRSSFCHFLEIKYTLQVKMVKDLLISWAKRTDNTKPTLFVGSMNHIQSIYVYLYENLVPKDAQDLFHDNPVIFVPKTKLAAHQVSRSLVEGYMLARGEVWWHDPSELFSYYQHLLKEYQSDLADKYLLSYFYSDDKFHSFFTNVCRIQQSPNMMDFAELLKLVVTVYSPTDKNVFSNVLKIYSIIGFHLTPHESDSGHEAAVKQQDKSKVIQILEKQKIFCSKKKVWVSLDDKPLLADNVELERMFSEIEKVHFLKLEIKLDKRSRPKPKDSGFNEEIMSFINLFSVPKLSQKIDMTSQTLYLEPCPKLQLYVHHILPIIQRYIYSYYEEVYNQLIQRKMAETMSNIQFFQASKLEVIYTIKDISGVIVPRTEKCICSETEFQFDKAHIDDFPVINKELARFFSEDNVELRKYLGFLLMELTPIVNKSTSKLDLQYIIEKEEIEPLPSDEVVWFIPAPIIQPVIPPPPPPPPISVTPDSDNQEKTLRSWPPQAPDTDRRKTDSSHLPAKPLGPTLWPPPAPEGHVIKHRTDRLPSNIKLVSAKPEEGTADSQNPVEGDRKPQSGDGTQQRPEYQRSSSRQEHQPGTAGSTHCGRPTSAGSDGARSSGDHQTTEGRGNSDIKPTISRSNSTEAGDNADDATQGGESRKRKTNEPMDGNSSKRRASSPPLPDQFTDAKMVREDNGQHSHSPIKSHDTNLKKAFDIPKWQDTSQLIPYEDLPSSTHHPLPDLHEDLEIDRNATDAVGRWGEQVIYDYLLKQQNSNPSIEKVVWVNEKMESGRPYDFEISYRSQQGELLTMYSDVKSTLSSSKRMFETSMQEVKFAVDQNTNYEIYRLFNAGESNNIKVVRISNVSEKQNIKLFMYI